MYAGVAYIVTLTQRYVDVCAYTCLYRSLYIDASGCEYVCFKVSLRFCSTYLVVLAVDSIGVLVAIILDHVCSVMKSL